MIRNKLLVFGIAVGLLGCSQTQEVVKEFWGSSTRALEEARANAIAQNYKCSFDECFEAVLSLARSKEEQKLYSHWIEKSQQAQPSENDSADQKKKLVPLPVTEGFFDVFIKDKTKRMIVVMGIVGNVDTTEIGIFFTRYRQDAMRVEISSLSTTAKVKVAKAVFEALDKKFGAVN